MRARLSVIAGCLAWLTVFGQVWLVILDVIPADSLRFGLFLFSLAVAIVAGLVGSPYHPRNQGQGRGK